MQSFVVSAVRGLSNEEKILSRSFIKMKELKRNFRKTNRSGSVHETEDPELDSILRENWDRK